MGFGGVHGNDQVLRNGAGGPAVGQQEQDLRFAPRQAVALMRDLAAARGLVPMDAVEVTPGSAEKGTPKTVTPALSALEIIESDTCDMPTCHSAEVVERYKGTESQAEIRVAAHVKKKAAISEEQAAALKKFFTREQAVEAAAAAAQAAL